MNTPNITNLGMEYLDAAVLYRKEAVKFREYWLALKSIDQKDHEFIKFSKQEASYWMTRYRALDWIVKYYEGTCVPWKDVSPDIKSIVLAELGHVIFRADFPNEWKNIHYPIDNTV